MKSIRITGDQAKLLGIPDRGDAEIFYLLGDTVCCACGGGLLVVAICRQCGIVNEKCAAHTSGEQNAALNDNLLNVPIPKISPTINL